MGRFALLAGGALLVMAGSVVAQDGSAVGGTAMRVFDHFLVKGGAITWFVLVPLSVATVALTIEYCLSIRRQTFVPPETIERIAEHLSDKRYAEALEYTADDPSILAGVVNVGLMESANDYGSMERAVEESLEEHSSRAMRKIEYLNVIGNISPMVGLFGTVYGMISLFASIREAGGMPEPARIADDISIALVTTFWGLLVAIPALSVFALFRNRIDVLTAECAVAANRLLAPFKPSVEHSGKAAVQSTRTLGARSARQPVERAVGQPPKQPAGQGLASPPNESETPAVEEAQAEDSNEAGAKPPTPDAD